MVFNEREAIRFRMERIAEEKKVLYQRDRELDKEYNFYIQRLRELDHKGLGSSTNLMHNEPNEDRFQTNSPQQSLESDTDRKYKGNLRQYDFEAIKRGLSNFKKKRNENKPEPHDLNQFRLDPNDRRRRGKQYDLKEVAGIVEEILRENGEAMEIHKLRDILADKGYKWKHFLPTLPNIMKHSDHIEKPYRGHISYVNHGTEETVESQKPEADTTPNSDQVVSSDSE